MLGSWILRFRRWEALPEASFLGRAVALQLAITFVLFVVLYWVGHQQVTADVPAYYLPAAKAVLSGQVPFRDKPCFGLRTGGMSGGYNDGL